MFGFFEAIYAFLTRHVGTRTDAADAGGSLHAKFRNVDAKIGTSADGRAANTIFGWLNSPVKSWQRVTFTPNTVNQFSVTISSVNPAKCLVFLDGCDLHYASGSQSASSLITRYVSSFTATSIGFSSTLISGIFDIRTFGTYSVIIVELY
ncbi:MAG: hypothetical protein AB1815_02545 [Bacillota bacterium]